MDKPPKIDGAAGLVWRARADHWVATWVAGQDVIKRGFFPKTQRLWPPTSNPRAPLNDEIATYIRSECVRLQDQMLAWKHRGATGNAIFDGKLRGLIECYRRDPESPFHDLRFRSRRTYSIHLDAIEFEVGDRVLGVLTGRDFKRWFKAWSAPDFEDDVRHVPRAHARITMLRILFSFGVAMEFEPAKISHCVRLATILSNMEFEQGRARTEYINAEQAIAIRRKAHEMKFPSVALAQAFQYDLMVRPKDVIGEWLPLDEPGTSDVVARGEKWLFGFHWREVDQQLKLKHRLSKSLRGRQAVMDPHAGELKVFDLWRYPMVMEELALIPDDLRRGPMVVDEKTGLPYRPDAFSHRWRQVATAAGVPKKVQNRDSRSGAITEGLDATDGNVEAVRQAAGHRKSETTLRYSRGVAQNTAKVADLRAAKRPTNRNPNGQNDGQ